MRKEKFFPGLAVLVAVAVGLTAVAVARSVGPFRVRPHDTTSPATEASNLVHRVNRFPLRPQIRPNLSMKGLSETSSWVVTRTQMPHPVPDHSDRPRVTR